MEIIAEQKEYPKELKLRVLRLNNGLRTKSNIARLAKCKIEDVVNILAYNTLKSVKKQIIKNSSYKKDGL